MKREGGGAAPGRPRAGECPCGAPGWVLAPRGRWEGRARRGGLGRRVGGSRRSAPLPVSGPAARSVPPFSRLQSCLVPARVARRETAESAPSSRGLFSCSVSQSRHC